MGSKKNADKITIEETLNKWATQRNLKKDIRNSVYISTPITTGPLFIKWMNKKGKSLKGMVG